MIVKLFRQFRTLTSIMKKILFVLFIYACSEQSQIHQLEKIEFKLDSVLTEKTRSDSMMMEVLHAFQVIDSNSLKIQAEEKEIEELAKAKMSSAQKKKLMMLSMDTIKMIMDSNERVVNHLEVNLARNEVTLIGLNEIVGSLEDQVELKEFEVEEFKGNLAEVSEDFSSIFMDYVETTAKNMELTEQLQAAWFAMGTKLELKQEGITVKKGLFDSNRLNEEFDREHFTKVNIDEFLEVEINAKKATLITVHPKGSYRWDKGDKTVEKLVILKPKEFWNVSNYLLIEVEY